MPEHDRPHSPSPTIDSAPTPERAELTTDFSYRNTADPTTTSASAPLLNAGRYQILDEIARGGVGVVYRAHDSSVHRDVAVKALQEQFRKNPVAISRFVEEGQITGQLQHPGIPAVHEIGSLPDGSPFLAMKLVKGATLADQIGGLADRGRLVAVFLQVAQAVGYAHSKGVLHRDLKPANVMVGQFGEVQVMDWGLAKVLSKSAPAPKPREQLPPPQHSLIETGRSSDPGSETQAGSVLGTPAYMPPEQAGGEVDLVDERADVFGLGAILCTILTGEPPYQDKTADAVRLRAVRGQVEDAFARLDACGADPELIGLCKRCLCPDRENRPRNGAALAEAVSAHLAAVEDRLRRAERERAVAAAKAAEQRARRRWQMAVAAAGVLILALLAGGAWWADRQAAERERDRAVAAERDRQEAVALLTHAEDVLVAGDLAAADVALAQAAGRVGANVPAELRDRLAAAKQDRDLVRDLRELEDMSWVPGYVSMPDQAAMADRYRAVFARYGLDVGGAGAAADFVRASRVSAALTAGLGEWFVTDPRPQLRHLMDRLDPEPNRVAVRAAIQAGDEGKVRTLVRALDGATTPAWFAVSVGYHRMVPFEDGVRLMTAAWRAHPTDYALAFRISQRLWGTRDDLLPEMLAWARVAVALRPDSPFAHNQLATVWRGMHKWDEAEAVVRRALELSRNYPKYAGARVALGNILLEKGNLEGAEANYRAALAIDPDTAGPYYNLGLVHDRRGDLAGSEGWYRKAVAKAPANAYYRQVLDGVARRRARLDDLAAGRADPASVAEAIALAESVVRLPRPRYGLAMHFYRWAFAVEPARADQFPHGYNAACCAARVAAGQDEETAALGVEEWAHLTGLARKWLRADLARLAGLAKDPKRQQEVRAQLEHWKKDADLASVRDREWLAAMPLADRAAWEAFWHDLGAFLAPSKHQAGPP
jgi:tetratricopeptide (TPR) repeat protein